MKFIAEINIMPQKALLDPQGKAVSANLKNIGLDACGNVRIGKHITMEVDAGSATWNRFKGFLDFSNSLLDGL